MFRFLEACSSEGGERWNTLAALEALSHCGSLGRYPPNHSEDRTSVEGTLCEVPYVVGRVSVKVSGVLRKNARPWNIGRAVWWVGRPYVLPSACEK